MRLPRGLLFGALSLLSLSSACLKDDGASPGPQPPCPQCPPPALFPVIPAPTAPAPPTVEEARAFFAKVDADLRKLFVARETMGFVNQTHITSDTERLAAQMEEAAMEYLGRSIQEARRYEPLDLPPELARQALLLRLAGTAPAPADAKERGELAELLSSMQSAYGKGKHCSPDGKKCRDLGELSKTLRQSKNYDELQEAWAAWHTISKPMRSSFSRYVELGNKGAQEIGFRDMGALWRSGYDMPPEAFEADVERLWSQVKPLYDDLHCYVRGKLRKRHGKEKVKDHGAIPAHLLGNMWAQEWTDLFPMVEPHPGQGSLDVTASLKRQKYDAVKMVKLAEGFFVSLGMDPLPKTFWERSLLTKPRDREVVCHASAWDVSYNDDLRIKMCIKVDEEDLITIHHELGHNYYYHHYYRLPMLFQSGANDGFHEAVGDTLALSVTPAYLRDVKLVDRVTLNDKADLNFLMKQALDKVAFLPFGLLIDKWRWDVFSGKTSKADYNKAWWDLRRKYQGVEAPLARSEEDFDPGAKYHVPANTPYVRYFLARIYQFQFHRALCKIAGHQGPLLRCSIHDNKAAGQRLMAMLKLGASKPWPDALEALSGERQADASAMVEYFAPLSAWLKEQNKGESCGWDGEATAPTASPATPPASPATPTASSTAPSPSPSASGALARPEGAETRGDAPPRGRELFCARKGSGGSVRHGPFRSWSAGGKPEVEGEYNDGKMHGRWTLFHPGGNRESEGAFAENKKEGVWIFYNTDGKKTGEKTYRGGEEAKLPAGVRVRQGDVVQRAADGVLQQLVGEGEEGLRVFRDPPGPQAEPPGDHRGDPEDDALQEAVTEGHPHLALAVLEQQDPPLVQQRDGVLRGHAGVGERDGARGDPGPDQLVLAPMQGELGAREGRPDKGVQEVVPVPRAGGHRAPQDPRVVERIQVDGLPPGALAGAIVLEAHRRCPPPEGQEVLLRGRPAFPIREGRGRPGHRPEPRISLEEATVKGRVRAPDKAQLHGVVLTASSHRKARGQ